MAWVEQTGTRSWRVRYARPTGGHGSVSGFASRKAAEDYAGDLESDRRRGQRLDPDGARTTVGSWVLRWVPTLDVETRTEENHHSYLRNHILPRWQTIPLGDITALAVTSWRKDLRKHLAASTVACIFTVFSMLLDDAVDERLIPTSPVHRRRRRGRRRDHASSPTERVWALPEHVLRIADQAGVLGGPSAALLVITAAWTGCRWGELAGLQNRSSPPARPPLSNRLVETYSHVAPEIEHRLLKTLEQRWQQAQRLRKPVDNRPRRRPAQRAPHTHPALRTTGQRPMMTSRPQARMTVLSRTAHIREANSLPIPPPGCIQMINDQIDWRSSAKLRTRFYQRIQRRKKIRSTSGADGAPTPYPHTASASDLRLYARTTSEPLQYLQLSAVRCSTTHSLQYNTVERAPVLQVCSSTTGVKRTYRIAERRPCEPPPCATGGTGS